MHSHTHFYYYKFGLIVYLFIYLKIKKGFVVVWYKLTKQTNVKLFIINSKVVVKVYKTGLKISFILLASIIYIYIYGL